MFGLGCSPSAGSGRSAPAPAHRFLPRRLCSPGSPGAVTHPRSVPSLHRPFSPHCHGLLKGHLQDVSVLFFSFSFPLAKFRQRLLGQLTVWCQRTRLTLSESECLIVFLNGQLITKEIKRRTLLKQHVSVSHLGRKVLHLRWKES